MSFSQLSFDGFRLDSATACLWRGADPLPLPPKVFAVLHYLMTYPDRLVTKDELLDAVWPHTAVSDAVVRVAIGTLRKALDDTAQPPRYIATVSRRGYRFLAAVTVLNAAASTPALPSSPRATPTPLLLLERETVLQHLHTAWQQACQGMRQSVFITGEAGIGKTAVVEAFAAQIRTDATVWLATGRCVEHYGAGEAYLPILEALGDLCRGPGGEQLVALLRQHAPTWLVQFPSLLTDADRALLHNELQGTTRERMLREGAEVLDVLTMTAPLVLLLEDLHWSDATTVDLLALLARRRTPARLLVLGTYRPLQALGPDHPLRAVVPTLQQQGNTTELCLELLSPAAVGAYLTARWPQPPVPTALAAWLHQRTDGHPLFLVALVQALVTQGILHADDGRWTVPMDIEALTLNVPDSLWQLLIQQSRRLPPETQRVLEVASVAGVEFVAAAVAAGLEGDVNAVEEHCETLVTQQLLRSLGVSTWPNGLVVTRYAFRHALYQQGVYEQVGVGRRMRLHQRLGAYLEGAYGPQAGEMAAELAEHFVRGHDTRRAVQYLHQAAENAARRYAHREVVGLLTRALALLGHMPEMPERHQQELTLQLALGGAWMALKGFAAPEAGHAFSRARVLCQQVEDPFQRFPALYGVWLFTLIDGALRTAQELAEQLLHLAQQSQDTACLLVASWASSTTCWHHGEFLQALTHARHGVALYDPQHHRELAVRYVFDPGVTCLAMDAIALALLGAPDQALARIHDALSLAQELAYPLSLAYVLATAMIIHQHRREPQATGEWAAALVALCTAHGPALYVALGKLFQGWVLAAQGAGEEALGQMRQSIAAFRTTGAAMAWQPHALTMLAEVSAQAGQPKEGLHLLAEAQTVLETTGERWWEAEVHRLRGELLWRHAMPEAAQAETCLQHALTVARRQQAKALELRAATSLARLWQQQNKHAEAHQLLADVYGWFSEGFDTADLRDARTLLNSLSGSLTACPIVGCMPRHRVW